MRRLSYLVLALQIAAGLAAYQPGTPGAAWTDEELAITKGKLYWIFSKSRNALKLVPGGEDALIQLAAQRDDGDGDAAQLRDALTPTAAKIVRLSFHDCVPEESGAGCNGCLNMEGMGNMYSVSHCAAKQEGCPAIHPEKGPFATDNNNLYWAAVVLEHLYKDPNFGPDDYTQHFSQSLYESGKSRADLWALAGMLGVVYTSDKHNIFCRNKPCARRFGDFDAPCEYELPYIEFKHGRADCVSDCPDSAPFCTTNHEIHPNPHGNGKDTTDYFKDNFGFTEGETIALMGVHTLGHPNEVNSMFRHYQWTAGEHHRFDNGYFINMVNTTGYRQHLLGVEDKDYPGQCIASRFLGNEYGQPIDITYKIRSERRTGDWGPFNWNLFGNECNYTICQEVKAADGVYSINSCCTYLEKCIDTNTCKVFKGCSETSCEIQELFYNTNMLNVDMGLYKEFSTGEDGRPRGCPGLEASTEWLSNSKKFPISNPPDCPNNVQVIDEITGETMADRVEKYAADNDAWVNDFLKVFKKMMEKGGENLTPASRCWFDAKRRRGIWKCL